jgi:hypothetical protein
MPPAKDRGIPNQRAEEGSSLPAAVRGRFSGLLSALCRLRLHQIAREFNVRLDEGVSEPKRIAGQLHDRLLQSFQGVARSHRSK